MARTENRDLPAVTGDGVSLELLANINSVNDAKAAGAKLKARGLVFDIAFTSVLMRAQEHQQMLQHPKVKELIEVHKEALEKGLMKARKWEKKKAGK